MEPDELFSVLVDHFAGQPGVTVPNEGGPRRFGTGALKVHGSIFAMIPRGQLVLKLPKARVVALVADGSGIPFDANKGRPMKEWLTYLGQDMPSWIALSEEALAFVSALKRRN